MLTTASTLPSPSGSRPAEPAMTTAERGRACRTRRDSQAAWPRPAPGAATAAPQGRTSASWHPCPRRSPAPPRRRRATAPRASPPRRDAPHRRERRRTAVPASALSELAPQEVGVRTGSHAPGLPPARVGALGDAVGEGRGSRPARPGTAPTTGSGTASGHRGPTTRTSPIISRHRRASSRPGPKAGAHRSKHQQAHQVTHHAAGQVRLSSGQVRTVVVDGGRERRRQPLDRRQREAGRRGRRPVPRCLLLCRVWHSIRPLTCLSAPVPWSTLLGQVRKAYPGGSMRHAWLPNWSGTALPSSPP